MKKILISGISGFIGGYLANHLIENGFFVSGIIRSGKKIRNLNQNIKLYISDLNQLNQLKIEESYDTFIHLAAANDIDSKDEEKALINTTLGTKKALEFCKENKIKNFIYFSTFQVYGTDNGFINNQTKIHCKNDYAITHLFAEEYVENFAKTNSLNYLILRPTNVFGAAISNEVKRDSLVPNCFCKSLIETQKITLLSSGKQFRNFISLKEVSQYIVLFLSNFEKYNKKTLILCSDRNIAISEVAQMALEIYNKANNNVGRLEILNENPKLSLTLNIDISELPKLHFSKNEITKEIIKIYTLYSNKEI